MDIGKNVKDARKRAQLSQEALARQAGISVSAVAQIEQGERTDPHYSTLSKLAKGLGISVGELLDSPKAEAPTSATSREVEDRRTTEPGTVGRLADLPPGYELPPGSGTAYERLWVEDRAAARRMVAREAERLRSFLEGVDLSPKEREVINESLENITELVGAA